MNFLVAGQMLIFSQLSRLEYIHSHNYIHGDIKPQNILMGLGKLSQTAFLIDFGITKKYWNSATGTHIPFRQGRRLTGTPAFTSINSHLGLNLGRRDDLESLAYTLIYLLRGSLPWLTSDHEKLSSTSILERKATTSVECLCRGVPSEIATMVIYSRGLAFSEEPDYDYIRSLFHTIRATLPASAACSLDLSQPDDAIVHPPLSFSNPMMTESVTPCQPQPISQFNDRIIPLHLYFNDHLETEAVPPSRTMAPLRRSTRLV